MSIPTTERVPWGLDLLGRHVPSLAVIARIHATLSKDGDDLSIETYDIIDGWNIEHVGPEGVEVLAEEVLL